MTKEKENQDPEEKKLNIFTKIGIVVIIVSIITIYAVFSMQLSGYAKAVIILVLFGLILKLAERVIIDIHNMWDRFDFWRVLRR